MTIAVPVPGLRPRDATGHQFVVYGDSCSGVPGGIHEATTAAVNAVVARLDPPPEFICFLGDEVIGLTTSDENLRGQWRHWLEVEMAWLDRTAIPLYHTTGNHTTYDAMSERVFQDVLGHLPGNGPEDQAHLSYAVRRGNLLLVFVNTMFTGLGEGRVETVWLDAMLAQHADARYRLVFGHHPVFPINGFGGEYQRELEHANGGAFWDVLVRHRVDAYFGSHMLAFDARVVEGVLHLVTAGAGTKHRMPETEYLHAMQVAIDAGGLRYQVLDDEGRIRESLDWPPRLPASSTWPTMAERDEKTDPLLRVWRIDGICAESGGAAQTLVSARNDDDGLPPVWIGLQGPEQRLGMLLSPQAGRSPHLWFGPTLAPGQPFSIQVALHAGLGPGGMLWRYDDEAPWSSLSGASAWGAERLPAIARWQVGISGNEDDRPFRGRDLRITAMSLSGA